MLIDLLSFIKNYLIKYKFKKNAKNKTFHKQKKNKVNLYNKNKKI